MGADSFIVYVGVRHEVVSDAELEHLEMRDDPRLMAARRAGLQAYVGRETDGKTYFLLIGTELGRFGVQDRTRAEVSEDELRQIAEETRTKLRRAGIEGEPRLHLQMQAQY